MFDRLMLLVSAFALGFVLTHCNLTKAEVTPNPPPPVPQPNMNIDTIGPCAPMGVVPFGRSGEPPSPYIVYDCGRGSLLFVPYNPMRETPPHEEK